MKAGDRVEVFTPWAAQGGGRPPLYEWFDGFEVVELGELDVLVRDLGAKMLDRVLVRHRRENVRKKRMALILDGTPRDDGRVSLTALWLERGRIRPRAQCFRTNPEHFSAFETKHCTTDEEALAWLERK